MSSRERAEFAEETVEYPRGDGVVREILVGWLDGRGRQRVKDIEYRLPGGEMFRLSDVLPEGVRLFRLGDPIPPTMDLEDRSLSYSRIGRVPSVKEKKFPPWARGYRYEQRKEEFFSSPGAFLGLFHEIGHLRRREEEGREELPRRRERELRLRAEGLTPLVGKDREDFLLVLQEERDAWAFALRLLRELRRRGIDLEPELQTKEDILTFVHAKLHSYERAIETKERRRERQEQLISALRGLENGISELAEEFVREQVRPMRERREREH
jgi:hypothetical protein